MKKRKGFTLIELLVVIAIIVILMAILMPVASRVRKQARNVVCQSRLKQWSMIMYDYINSNNGFLPYGEKCSERFMFGSDIPNNPVHNIDTKGIRFCPAAVRLSKDYVQKSRGMQKDIFQRDQFMAWEYETAIIKTIHHSGRGVISTIEEEKVFTGSYGFNTSIFREFIDTTRWRSNGKGFNVYSLKGTSNIPVILDSHWIEGFIDCTNGPIGEVYHTEGRNPFVINRHEGHVNSLFMDWSVRKVGLKELWKLKWYRDFDTNGPLTKAGGVQSEDWPEWMRGFKDY